MATFSTQEVLERLEILWRKLEDEGRYVSANTVSIATDEIKRLTNEDQQAAFIQGAYDQGRADAEAQIAPHLHLIWVFADDLTQRNFLDKSDYIKQQIDRIRSALAAERGTA